MRGLKNICKQTFKFNRRCGYVHGVSTEPDNIKTIFPSCTRLASFWHVSPETHYEGQSYAATFGTTCPQYMRQHVATFITNASSKTDMKISATTSLLMTRG